MKYSKLIIWLLISIIFLPAFSYSQFSDFTFLRVDNFKNGYNKVKLGNNPNSFWNPKVDVTAGGNTHLTITFRMPEGAPDYSKIQIRPNGSSASPVNIGHYLPAGFANSYDWTTISVPLGDFDASIDLSQLYLIQIPYSSDAGNFVFDLKRLEFTGGSTPYLWHGAGKRGNIHDGNGYTGQAVAHEQSDLYLSADLSYSKAVAPYNGSAKLIATYKDQYDQETFDHLWTWQDGYVGRERNNLAPGPYKVVFGPIEGAYDTLHFELLTQGPIHGQVQVNTPTSTGEGGYSLVAQGGVPPYETNKKSGKMQYGVEEDILGEFADYCSGMNLLRPDVIDDHYGNYYLVTGDCDNFRLNFMKRDYENNLIWKRDMDFVLRHQYFYTDDLGNTLTLQRLRKESYIDGKRFISPYELHAFVFYDFDGNIKWIKYIDDIQLSAQTTGVVVDKQGKVTWALRQWDHKGKHTIMITLGMNGNEISRIKSEGNTAQNTFHSSDYIVILPSDEVVLLAEQTAGTNFAGYVSSQDGHSFYRFSKEGSLELATYLPGKFVPEYLNTVYSYNVHNNKKLVFRKLLPSDEYGYRNNYSYNYYDENGVKLWEINEGKYRYNNHFGDNYVYRINNDSTYILTYELDTIGAFVNNRRIIKEDRRGKIHVVGPYYVFYLDHKRLTLNYEDSGTIPAGSTSFNYELTDQVNNKYTYSASFVSSRVSADTDAPGLSQGREGLAVYPNPSASDIQFLYSEGLPQNALTMTDLSGKVIQSWRNIPVSGFTIPRNGLQAGVYLLSFEDAAGKTTKRIIFK